MTYMRRANVAWWRAQRSTISSSLRIQLMVMSGRGMYDCCMQMARKESIVARPSEWIEDIRSFSLQQYEHAVQELSVALPAQAGVRCAGVFGETTSPGISDIDVLVICDDHCYADLKKFLESWRMATEERQYMFTHQLFLLPASLAHLRPILFFSQTFSPFQCIGGNESLFFDQSEPPSSLQYITQTVWRSTIWRILYEVDGQAYGMRKSLQLLKGQCRQLTIVESLLGIHLESTRCEQAVVEARSSRSEEDLNTAWHLVQQQWVEGERAVQQRNGSSLYEAMCSNTNVQIFSAEDMQSYHAALQEGKNWGKEYCNNPDALFLSSGGLFPSFFNMSTGSTELIPDPLVRFLERWLG